MDSVRIQCPIPIKAIMTEQLREELLLVEQANAQDIEHQLSLLQNFAATQDDVFERQRRLLVQQAEVETRIARVANAPLGEHFLLRVVQGVVDLAVGDNFLEKMGTEVLLENGVVISIVSSRQVPESEEASAEAEETPAEPVAS